MPAGVQLPPPTNQRGQKPMTYRKLQLAMVAASGLLTSAAYEGIASADVGAAQVSKILAPSTDDLAPVTGNPPRLRRSDEDQREPDYRRPAEASSEHLQTSVDALGR